MSASLSASASAWQFAVPFLGRHVLRLLVVLLIVGPLIGWRARRRGERPGQVSGNGAARLHRMLQARYAIAGVILGVTWVWHENQPPWEHAVRVLVVLLVLGPALRWIRRRVTAAPPGRSGRGFPVRIWIVAKLTLVAAGLGLEWLLEIWISRSAAAIIVGAALVVSVAFGGPALHRWYAFGPSARARRAAALESPPFTEDAHGR